MKFFYLTINNSLSEPCEVHSSDCPKLPDMLKRTYLGPFNNGREALRSAKLKCNNVVKCPVCCQANSYIASFTSVGFVEK